MFFLIISLMSLSLIGIIIVQIYWISNAAKSYKKQFDQNVISAMNKAVDNILEKDFIDFYAQFVEFHKAKKNFLKELNFQKFVYEQTNTSTNTTFRFSSNATYENYYNSSLREDGAVIRSGNIKNELYTIRKRINNAEMRSISDQENLTFYNSLNEVDKQFVHNVYIINKKPIHKRISKQTIHKYLKESFDKYKIPLEFGFGVYEKDRLIRLKSDYFKYLKGSTFRTVMFDTKNRLQGEQVDICVNFLNEKKYVYKQISLMLFISIFFTVVIITSFGISIHQMFFQEKLSDIKTDFINNITHEFKTPIATINIALESMKNPKIIENKESVFMYMKMIKEENKRMLCQVENILRISKLQKDDLKITTEPLNYISLVQEAVKHLDLLLKQNEGVIRVHLSHLNAKGQGSKEHLLNSFVNVIENGIKYSKEKPQIDIYFKNEDKFFVIEIQDKGIGMSKSVQKRIFDKFYREQKGNIHDVKGHGLGLTYAKKVLSYHRGKIEVRSEKNKGSVFTIKLPLFLE